MPEMPSRKKYKKYYSSPPLSRELRDNYNTFKYTFCITLDLEEKIPIYCAIKINFYRDKKTATPDKSITILNQELSRSRQANIKRNLKTDDLCVKDRKHFGELIFLLAAKFKKDLFDDKIKTKDNAGFLHTKEINNLNPSGNTGGERRCYIGKNLYRTFSKFNVVPQKNKKKSTRPKELYDFITSFLVEPSQLHNLICHLGTIEDEENHSESFFWWLNVSAKNDLIFKNVNTGKKIPEKNLKECFEQLFADCLLSEDELSEAVKNAEVYLPDKNSIGYLHKAQMISQRMGQDALQQSQKNLSSHDPGQQILCPTSKAYMRSNSPRTVNLLHAVPADPDFVGRHREIDLLNKAWNSSCTHIVSIIAWGGFGKSVLVRQWLEEIATSSPHHAPKKIFWWSFYQNNSVDSFLEVAIKSFSPKTQPAQSLHHCTEEGFDVLISLLRESPSILVLDGFEDIQYSQAGDYFGKCKSYQLANFIRRVSEGVCSTSLCVITSRLPIADIHSFKNKSYIEINLEESPLHINEARLLLRKHGVKGSEDCLNEIIEDHGSHPLALVTIATLLSNFFSGDAQKASSMPSITISDSNIGDRFKLWNIFSWYDSLLTDAERYILRIVSLFRQIAPWTLLLSLIKTNKAKNIVDVPQISSEIKIKATLFHLNQLQLIRFARDTEIYSMHPLLKTFFEFSINSKAGQGYHESLFFILQQKAPNQPSSLHEMWPLIEAVYHGCKCDHEKEALNIFRERIERKAGYLTKNLGAWETKIELCSMFFSNRHFSGKCLLSSLEKQGHLLNAAGFAYLNIGLPLRAVPLFNRAATAYSEACLQGDEGQVQRNRADTFLRIGSLEDAINAANRSLLLDLSEKSQQSSLGYLGYAYALMGSFDLAEEAFCKALKLFGKKWLPPIRGIQYIEMLVFEEKYEEAAAKVPTMLKWVKKQKVLFSEAECYRVLAVAMAELAYASEGYEKAQEAIMLIKKAVNLANQAGVHYYIVRTFLDSIRIVLFLTIKKMNTLTPQEIKLFTKQVSEILRVAKESGYKLIEAETFLLSSYICLLKNDNIQANNKIKDAKKMACDLKYKCLEKRCTR